MGSAKRVCALVGIVALLWTSAADATTYWSDDFEAGLSPPLPAIPWTVNSGPATTSASPVPKGQSFVDPDGTITRISKQFDSGTDDVIRLSWEFYTNSTNATQRAGGGFNGTVAAVSTAATIRMGTENAANYRIIYIDSGAPVPGTQNLDTGMPLAIGWHTALLKITMSTKLVEWQIDSTSGSFTHFTLARPGAVTLGHSSSNGVAGDPDTTVWFDNVNVSPEPATLLLIGLGMLVRRRRAARV